jgi:vacuolar-type H+-ATPase subunit I/STV1
MQNDLHLQVQAANTDRLSRASRRSRSASRATVVLMIALWVLLVAGGAAGAAWYAGELRARMTADIERQTAAQISAMQRQVETRMAELETAFRAEIDAVEAKVAELNELLTFARDNAGRDTDDSNRLYAQLTEVKEKLEQLQKQLDVLK